MCDYSLGGIPNRLAVEGDVLTVHRFPTGSKGLASPRNLNRAVCIPDGARLNLTLKNVKKRSLGLKKEGPEDVIFRQEFRSLDGGTFRDTLEFKNGRMVKIQEFEEGQMVTVMSLDSRIPDPIVEPEYARIGR